MSDEPIVLLKGSDQILLADAAGAHLASMLGERDRDEVVDQFGGDEYELTDAVLAASAVSMFGDRVIVMRNAGRFNAEACLPLVNYAADPNPTSQVLVVWERPLAPSGRANAVPKKLSDAIKACGGAVVDCDVGSNAKARQGWLDKHLAASSVSFIPSARHLIAERLGEDVSRLGGVLRVLESSFPHGAKLTVDDIEPFLGEAGSVPPWELTDAIDGGDVSGAVVKLRRLVSSGGRHPLQVMATLTSHYQRMLRLDGARVANETEAAALLGMKGSTFPEKKAMQQARRLGSERLAAAIRLLAAADADLRGLTAVPAEAVLEVLVGRLARLAGRPTRR